METSNEVAAGDASTESWPWQLLQATLRNPWGPPGSWTLVVVLETSTGVVQVTLTSSSWTGSSPIQTSTWCTYVRVTPQPTLSVLRSSDPLRSYRRQRPEGWPTLMHPQPLWWTPSPWFSFAFPTDPLNAQPQLPSLCFSTSLFWRVTPARLTITYPFDGS